MTPAERELVRAALDNALESMYDRRGYCEMWEYKYGAIWDSYEQEVKVALAILDDDHIVDANKTIDKNREEARRIIELYSSSGYLHDAISAEIARIRTEAVKAERKRIHANVCKWMVLHYRSSSDWACVRLKKVILSDDKEASDVQ